MPRAVTHPGQSLYSLIRKANGRTHHMHSIVGDGEDLAEAWLTARDCRGELDEPDLVDGLGVPLREQLENCGEELDDDAPGRQASYHDACCGMVLATDL